LGTCRYMGHGQGFLKCKVDASFSLHSNKVGIGVCIRDEMRLSVGARTVWLEPILFVPAGEVRALLTAMCWIKELGFATVICFIDSKIVTDAFNDNRQDYSDATLFNNIVIQALLLCVWERINSSIKLYHSIHLHAPVINSIWRFMDYP